MSSSAQPTRILIFAKAPLPGFAKTRLIPILGSNGAAMLARKMLKHCITEALAANIGPVELCVTPDAEHPSWRELSISTAVIWSSQGEGDLGERLARATQRAMHQAKNVLLIGTDCPGLSAERLREAARAVEGHDACMVPVSDGGYALLGLRRHMPTVFDNIPWSSASVAQLTKQRILEEGGSLKLLASMHDIDEPQDLQFLPKNWAPYFSTTN
jgi:rSAM/selenodomain-associated transferase 1